MAYAPRSRFFFVFAMFCFRFRSRESFDADGIFEPVYRERNQLPKCIDASFSAKEEALIDKG